MARGDQEFQENLVNTMAAIAANLQNGMAQINNNVVNLNANMNANGNGNHPPPPPPLSAAVQISKSRIKPYEGETDAVAIENWVRAVEKQFEIHQAPEVDKVRIGAFFLARDADAWWRTVRPVAQAVPNFGWTQFKQMLEERFFPADNRRQKQDEFRECKQGKLSVQSYHDNFHKLVHFAGDVVTTEAQRLYYYMTGFSAKIKSCSGPRPTLFRQCITKL